MNSKLLLYILFSLVIVSCKVNKQLKTECLLNHEQNTIQGFDKESKEFYIKKLFIPSAIEDLLVNRDSLTSIEYSKYYNKVESKKQFAGFKISGCKDTTWAKITMANHLMKKYNVSRYDSIYLDTVYSITVIDPSKFTKCEEPYPEISNHFSKLHNEPHFIDMKCNKWSSICRNILKCGMDLKTNSYLREQLEGRFNITLPCEIYRRYGLEAYQNNLRDSLGIDMTYLRTDTIRVGVYDYKE